MAPRTGSSLPVLAALVLAPLCHGLFQGGGLTILSKNNLDALPSNGTAAILIHQPASFLAAEVSCTLLGESLWDPDRVPLASSALNSSLPYLSFAGVFPQTQQYWVSSPGPEALGCRTVNSQGHPVPEANCARELPVLCTQSAPLSNSTFADNGPAWRVTQAVGNATLMTGYRDTHTWKFRGVRYVAPRQRFEYSTAPFLQDGEVLAVDAGADCSQPVGEVKNGSSEDCLFMNIWTPHLPRATIQKEELKPVMVYLYGGGLTSGSGKNPNTDGTNLASRGDVVVVSVNYRVGSVGFLAFNDGVHKGNYALSDQVTALEWVKAYIRYFGGDADRVTLFGESAGAQSTHILLGSPKAKGLFHRAIMQSDPQGYPRDGKFTWMTYDTVEEAYNGGTTRVLKEAGCLNSTDQIGCLGKLSGFQLVNLTNNINNVVIDGTYLTDPHLIVNATGQASNISIITGVNRDEAGVFVDNFPSNGSTFASYAAQVLGSYNLDPSLLNSTSSFSAFSVSNASSPPVIFNTTLAISTDGQFTCLDMAKAFTGVKHNAFASAYSYVFNRTIQPNGYTQPWCMPKATSQRPLGDPDSEYFKCHAGEQLVMFGNALRAGQPDRDGRDVPFMQLVVDYWAAFARTGDPNPDVNYLTVRDHAATLQQVQSRGKWEAVRADAPTLRLLQWDGAQLPFGGQERCDALEIGLNTLEPSS